MQYQINIIGCGRLGSVIGYLLRNSGQAVIKGICNASLASGQKAVEFIGQGTAYQSLTALPPADIYFILTPDNLIENTCNELIATHKIKPGAIVVHCSGSLSSDILHAAKKQGCAIASIHPIKSFANPSQSIKNFAGTYCSYEGDAAACQIVGALFAKLDAIIFPINKDKKNIYHAASVFAVNYLMALFDIAENCYAQADIPADVAKKIILNLMSGALENLAKLSPQQALTGPLQRGDHAVIANHIAALSAHPSYLEVYNVLGKIVLDLTAHSDEKKKQIFALLSTM